jgi:hypothetical protein
MGGNSIYVHFPNVHIQILTILFILKQKDNKGGAMRLYNSYANINNSMVGDNSAVRKRERERDKIYV